MLVRIERKVMLEHYAPGHNVWRILDGADAKVVEATPWTYRGRDGYYLTDGENRANVLAYQVTVLD